MRRPCLPGHAVARDLSRQSGVLVWHGETSGGYLALAGHELLTAATAEEMRMKLAARGLLHARQAPSPRPVERRLPLGTSAAYPTAVTGASGGTWERGGMSRWLPRA
ncbi:hypothetical protein ACQEU5_18080 [Marinactinospora thermotolerans]|uniref:Uncharacterized protein n=1 Tax=Marinactinospora thermotolerans DSM 45154 TaxID=1122192 RepID=A0A1T4TGF7_9ACTN|nr:hypothetical protein [Marinactinospora thermotolerans]SKA39512.1 hypothetical protein SAMN02745673_04988 [Marinactinospora thermotolerans DSM 45154]